MADQNQESAEQPKSLEQVAREAFGDKLTGEPPADEENKPDSEETEDVEATEDTEQEEVKEAEETEDLETSEESEEEEFVSTLDEFIESMELDPEHVKGLKVNLKVDGEEVETTLGDVLATNQTMKAAEKRLEDSKTKHTKAMEGIEAQKKQLSEAAAVAGQLINEQFEDLEAEEKKIDWDSLEKDDPAAFAAKKVHFQERREKITQKVQQFKTKFTEQTEEQKKQAEDALEKLIEAEQKALFEAIPEWKDPKVLETEGKAITDFLVGRGVKPQELKNMYDHRAYQIARMAWLYDQGQQKADVAAKKVKKIPKTLKPGAAKPANTGIEKKVERLRAKFERTGLLEDAHALSIAEDELARSKVA